MDCFVMDYSPMLGLNYQLLALIKFCGLLWCCISSDSSFEINSCLLGIIVSKHEMHPVFSSFTTKTDLSCFLNRWQKAAAIPHMEAFAHLVFSIVACRSALVGTVRCPNCLMVPASRERFLTTTSEASVHLRTGCRSRYLTREGRTKKREICRAPWQAWWGNSSRAAPCLAALRFFTSTPPIPTVWASFQSGPVIGGPWLDEIYERALLTLCMDS